MRVALTSSILVSLAITLLGCGDESADNGWPSYNRSLDGQRYSPLAQITTENVARLKPVCEMAMGEEGGFQTGPVVIVRSGGQPRARLLAERAARRQPLLELRRGARCTEWGAQVVVSVRP